MRQYFSFRQGSLLSAALALTACASTGSAPVEDRSLDTPRAPLAHTESRTAASLSGGTYTVRRGDTLYSIAFRNGVDYRELAGWNGINAPYTIYVGRVLRLGPASAPLTARVAATPSAPPALASAGVSVKPSVSAAPGPPPFQNVEAQSITAPLPAESVAPHQSVSTPVVPATVSGPAGNVPTSVTTAPPVAPPSTPAPQTANVSGEIAWRWPADGQLTGSFVGGDQTRQGIDIAGKAGDPVRATADGVVVYSGNGLIGYGELIIIKHNASFLSAYGHNRTRLVKEGDRVKSGQVIAEMGSSSASRDSLHFEIRKNGKPANPTDYLPRR